jgi:hypothetical protein
MLVTNPHVVLGPPLSDSFGDVNNRRSAIFLAENSDAAPKNASPPCFRSAQIFDLTFVGVLGLI